MIVVCRLWYGVIVVCRLWYGVIAVCSLWYGMIVVCSLCMIGYGVIVVCRLSYGVAAVYNLWYGVIAVCGGCCSCSRSPTCPTVTPSSAAETAGLRSGRGGSPLPDTDWRPQTRRQRRISWNWNTRRTRL